MSLPKTRTVRRVVVWALMKAAWRICPEEDQATAPTIIRTRDGVHITGGVMGKLHSGFIGGDETKPALTISNNLFWAYPDPRLIGQNPITPKLDALYSRWRHRKDGAADGGR